MTKPDELAVDAWAALLRAHRLLVGEVEAALKAANTIPLVSYDVLLELRRAGRPLRQRELEERMLLAQYGVSRLIDRLEADGFVERRPDPNDARARLIALTVTGRKALKAAWPVYSAAIESVVGEALSESELEIARDVLRKLSAASESRRLHARARRV